MEKVFLVLDVGGTQIKGGITDHSGNMQGGLLTVDACARESREIIFDKLAGILRDLLKRAEGFSVDGVGLAFPGPFDYEKGISLMKGLDKYESIYGISIRDEIKSRIPELRSKDITFLHDIEAFALGECWFGEMRDCGKILCLCIGTGTGSAFIENHTVLKEKKVGVPEKGWVYPTPYRDSCIDDYLSVRGLGRLGLRILGTACSGKELYSLCREGNGRAMEVYREFGKDLKACITPFLDGFQPDTVILGGQICKSFSYFGGDFRKECEGRGIIVFLEPETSVKAMQGLSAVMNDREHKIEKRRKC